MDALDIKNFVFDKSLRGYNIKAVKACLEEISEFVVSLQEKIYKLDRENKTLKSRLAESEKTQDEIKEIMISAQDFKHKILREAENKENEIVMKAQDKAKAIEIEAKTRSDEQIQQAKKELDSKKYQFEELKKLVSEFKLKLMEIYKAHIDLITKLPESNELEVANLNESDLLETEEKSNVAESGKNDFVEAKEESEVFENLQKKAALNNNDEENLFTGVRVQKNLSGNESIFKKNIYKNSNKNVVSRTGSMGDSYIKSRFEELEI